MKKYQSLPTFVNAMQWDGSAASLADIKTEFKIAHDAIELNEDQTIKTWSIGETSTRMQPVPVGAYFISMATGQLNVINKESFEASFEPATE
jgi:hypothetical protein